MSAALPARAPSWRWWITGLLLLATTINYMDRMTLVSASVRVTKQFHLTEQQYGNIEVVFGWAFGLGSLVFGFLADRWRVYWLYPAILAAWSLTGVATGYTHGYHDLLVCRGLLGFFEAGHWPCALKTTFGLLGEKDRTMGNSVLQSGASIGAIITPQVMKLLLTEQPNSWRTAFILVGTCGILWVVFWFAMLRPRDLAGLAARTEDSNLRSLCVILRGRRFWAVAVLLVGAHSVWHIYRVWLLKFLQTGRGYAESAALDFNSFFYLATDAGCLLAGAVSLWLIRQGSITPHSARARVYTGACMLTSLSVFLPMLGQGWLLLAILLLIGAGALALFPCYYSFVQELSTQHVGQLTGLLSLWVWSVASPVHSYFGHVADRTHSYDAGLVIAGVAPWLGVVALRLLWR